MSRVLRRGILRASPNALFIFLLVPVSLIVTFLDLLC